MAASPFGRDSLAVAITSEIRARDLYREIATRIKNRAGKRRLERLARDEDGHRAALESRYRRLYGAEYRFDPASPAGPRFDFVKTDIFTQAGALEVVSVAISAEKESAAYYQKQLESVTEPEDVKLLRRLVRFEEGHLRRLQREYNRLREHHTWSE